MVAAVAAQQPAGTPTPTPAAVLEALKRPTAPPDAPATGTTEDEASMTAVLARYQKMIAAGEADDTLDAIRTDLQAIVGRLDVLARRGGQ